MTRTAGLAYSRWQGVHRVPKLWMCLSMQEIRILTVSSFTACHMWTLYAPFAARRGTIGVRPILVARKQHGEEDPFR